MKTQEDRILFLREFTKELILNSKKSDSGTNLQVIPPVFPRTQQKIVIPLIKPIIRTEVHEMQREKSQAIGTSFSASSQEIYLGKIDSLVKNPEVNMIECSGPDKLLIVKKGLNTEATQIILNEDEIREILQNFSQATSTPLEGGIFKAQLGNLIITAVISDFVGSRFIISKIPI